MHIIINENNKTMTPKEKAQELVSSFMSIKNIKLSDYSVIYLPAAKQCALIVVDEILEVCSNETSNCSDKTFFYWQEVKQEIENLQS